MCLTSKHFNWTSHYRNPDGPCSVQASGGLQHVTTCNVRYIIIPFLLLVVHRTFSQDTQAGWVFLSLRDSGRFQGMLEGFGTITPSFLQTESMQSKNNSDNPCNLKIIHCLGWGKGSGLQWSRADLSDFQLEKISSINTPHLDLAQFTAPQDLTKHGQKYFCYSFWFRLLPLKCDFIVLLQPGITLPTAQCLGALKSKLKKIIKSKCFSTPQLC